MDPLTFATPFSIISQASHSLDDRLEQLNDFFKERVLQPYSSSAAADLINRKWSVIRDQACQNEGLQEWGPHLLDLNEAQIISVQNAFDQVIAGLERTGFDPFRGIPELDDLQKSIRHFLQDADSPANPYEHLTPEHFRAMFITHDPDLLARVREEIQAIFERILVQINEGGHDPKVTELLVGHLIGLYAFMISPSDDAHNRSSSVRLLQRINDEWKLVGYTVRSLQLTDPLLTSPIYAHGLTPTADHPDAAPLLLFHGTAPRTTSGSLLCYMTDLTPYFSVGEFIYNAGQRVIHDWMGQQDVEKTVHVYGISLGGSLAYHAGREYGSRVRVHSFVPAGLFPWTDRMARVTGETFCHEKDPVSLLGIHPNNTNFRFFRVVTHHDRDSHRAHVCASGCNPTLLLHSNSRHENERTIRKFFVILHQVCSVPLFRILSAYLVAKFVVITLAQTVARIFAWSINHFLPSSSQQTLG